MRKDDDTGLRKPPSGAAETSSTSTDTCMAVMRYSNYNTAGIIGRQMTGARFSELITPNHFYLGSQQGASVSQAAGLGLDSRDSMPKVRELVVWLRPLFLRRIRVLLIVTHLSLPNLSASWSS